MVTAELVELFRKAQVAQAALYADIDRARPRLTTEEHAAAARAVVAFEVAIGCRPWQRGPLHGERTDSQWAALRDALPDAATAPEAFPGPLDT